MKTPSEDRLKWCRNALRILERAPLLTYSESDQKKIIEMRVLLTRKIAEIQEVKQGVK